jgi:carbon storage regulator
VLDRLRCPSVHFFGLRLKAPGCVFNHSDYLVDAQFYPTWREAMLVLTRRIGEEIIIDEEICVTVVDILGDRVRLGITAPRDTFVDRWEVYERRRRPWPGKTRPPK